MSPASLSVSAKRSVGRGCRGGGPKGPRCLDRVEVAVKMGLGARGGSDGGRRVMKCAVGDGWWQIVTGVQGKGSRLGLLDDTGV